MTFPVLGMRSGRGGSLGAAHLPRSDFNRLFRSSRSFNRNGVLLRSAPCDAGLPPERAGGPAAEQGVGSGSEAALGRDSTRGRTFATSIRRASTASAILSVKLELGFPTRRAISTIPTMGCRVRSMPAGAVEIPVSAALVIASSRRARRSDALRDAFRAGCARLHRTRIVWRTRAVSPNPPSPTNPGAERNFPGNENTEFRPVRPNSLSCVFVQRVLGDVLALHGYVSSAGGSVAPWMTSLRFSSLFDCMFPTAVVP